MKNAWTALKLVWALFFGDLRYYRYELNRFQGLVRSDTWEAARIAVCQVMHDRPLQAAASREARVTYCPACGQTPTGDRRLDEARSVVIAQLGDWVPVRDINLALEMNYWLQRRV